MTPEELAAEIERLIVANSSNFAAIMTRVQGSILYHRIITILKDLELDSEGYIKQSAANRRILRQAESVFDEVVKSPSYQKAVNESLEVIPDIDKNNEKYFKSISSVFSPNRTFIKELQRQVIRDVSAGLLNEGVIANVRIPLVQILNQNINSGGSFSGFQTQLQNFIKGDEGMEGRWLRYSKTFLSDTLFNYARSWQEAVTTDLGLEFYLYSGGVTLGGKGSSGSRDFCIERTGQYFHRKEVESWAELDWKGKNPLTTESSIFTLLGGYNCRHSLIPVHLSIVPKDVLERATEQGFYRAAA